MTAPPRGALTAGDAAAVIGREDELHTLLGALSLDLPVPSSPPPVLFVHGIGGIGKTTLLGLVCDRARASGSTVVRLDCRTIEPTEEAFLAELGTAIGAPGWDTVRTRLADLGPPVLLVLDAYEVFQSMDAWLRQAFLPALPSEVRVVIAGRVPPVSAWHTGMGRAGGVRELAVAALRNHDARQLLERAGVPSEDARRLNRVARGHPLALRLAASVSGVRGSVDLATMGTQRVVTALSQLYLDTIADPLTRRALEAASVVRRVTRSLLGALLPETAPQDLYERLQALPFVEPAADGLHIHDTVREALAAGLRAADPTTYARYRRAAWQQLRQEVHRAVRADLWRYTADMLYLLENPAIRDAFFPPDDHPYGVEPAHPGDRPAILAISERYHTPTATAALARWWSQCPESVWVVRDHHGNVAGFFVIFAVDEVTPSWLEADPIMRLWWEHLQRDPVPAGQRVLFVPRLMSRDAGEVPDAVRAASALEIKRRYMELRPRLRRMYTAMRDISQLVQAAPLGLFPVPGTDPVLDGEPYHTLMLDFGPESVDGWLAGLVAAELGVEATEPLLDREAREAVLGGRRIALTRLEFGLMDALAQRQGKPVSRATLMENVWGYAYDGDSNVVEVAVAGLRKKLGDRAALVETVHGVGYRLRRP